MDATYVNVVPEKRREDSLDPHCEGRAGGDEWPTFSMERFETFSDADFKRYFSAIYDTEHHYLAISATPFSTPTLGA